MKQRCRRPQRWKGLWKPAGFQTPSQRGRRAEGNRLSQPKDPELVRSKAGLRARLPGSPWNTLHAHKDNVSEMLCTPCRAKGFLRRVFFVSTELVPLHQLEQTDTRQSPEAGSCCHFPQHRTTRAICSGNTL